MERYTVIATINGALTQRPILESNGTSSLPCTSFSQKSHYRDPSFSLNLRSEEPKFLLEDTEISIFDAQRYFNEGRDQKEKKKNSPVSINLDRIVEKCDPILSSVSSIDGYGRNCRIGSFNSTPTASSEASWNSQSGLLSNPSGSISVSMKNLRFDEKKRGFSSSNKWFFGRKCPCSGKKSVQVEDKFIEPKIPVHLNPKISKSGDVVNIDKAAMEKSLDVEEREKLNSVNGNWVKEKEMTRNSGRFSPENSLCVIPTGRSFNDANGFSFPILNPPTAGKLVINGVNPAPEYQPEDPPRESLEVFRPSDDLVFRKSIELQRRQMSFSGDVERRSFIFPVSPMTRTNMIDDDVASDASSDLFEIESFSTQTTMYPIYRRRDSLDEILNDDGKRYNENGTGILHFRGSHDEMTSPTEYYEPSEATIDWSVTTAEGFDQSSVTNFSISASDYDDVRFILPESDYVTLGGTVEKRKENGLLNCKCEKAVNVGPHPVKYVPEQCRAPIESRQISATSRLASLSSIQVQATRGLSKAY